MRDCQCDSAHWIGFTPADTSGGAREQCRAIINSQINGGYIIEYITRNFGEPNPGSERDARYIEEREAHRRIGGRLIAVHRLRASARPLIEILGEAEYNRIQDMWAADGKLPW